MGKANFEEIINLQKAMEIIASNAPRLEIKLFKRAFPHSIIHFIVEPTEKKEPITNPADHNVTVRKIFSNVQNHITTKRLLELLKDTKPLQAVALSNRGLSFIIDEEPYALVLARILQKAPQ